MNDAALTRYSRHLLLNEWGIEAQNKLLAAKVLVIGMGGLGCPAAQLLAASGVGQLTVVDDDTVDASNLLRQHLHLGHLGMNKARSAQLSLGNINPLCAVTAIEQRLAGAAQCSAVSAHAVVLDCSDNAATRYALNRACVSNQVPLVSGAAIRFDGQFIVFDARRADSPCYHCVFPQPSTAQEHTSSEDRCATTGVFAPLTQHIGTLQAAAAIKLIAGVGLVKPGQLHLFNALDASSDTVNIPKNKACKVCGC